MTPIILLDALKTFVEDKTKDLILPVRPQKDGSGETERAPHVYKMALPTKDDEINQIPYVIIQVLTGKDDQQAGEDPESVCNIRMVVATYSEDESDGNMYALNLITRIRTELLKEGTIGDQFYLKPNIEWVIYPDNSAPYYLGEMLTVWEMPIIKRPELPWADLLN